jgi:hypothetical protein
MKGSDDRERNDLDVWKLVDYDPLCAYFTMLRNQIADAIAGTPNSAVVAEHLLLLGRQLRECIYDKLTKGGG